jgi:LAO/AO transport system kinase
MGYDRILVETVGVGQDEIDVMKAADTSVVVTVPGLGDDIQAIKAGILEIADVLVVNKSDREGADRAVRDLVHMLDLRAPAASPMGAGARQDVEIVSTIATRGDHPDSGIAELAAAIDRHRDAAGDTDGAARRARQRAAAHVAELVRGLLAERARSAIEEQGGLDAIADAVASRASDPYSAAEAIVTRATRQVG